MQKTQGCQEHRVARIHRVAWNTGLPETPAIFVARNTIMVVRNTFKVEKNTRKVATNTILFVRNNIMAVKKGFRSEAISELPEPQDYKEGCMPEKSEILNIEDWY